MKNLERIEISNKFKQQRCWNRVKYSHEQDGMAQSRDYEALSVAIPCHAFYHVESE